MLTKNNKISINPKTRSLSQRSRDVNGFTLRNKEILREAIASAENSKVF